MRLRQISLLGEDEKASAGELSLPTLRDLYAGQQLGPGEEIDPKKQVRKRRTY
jgi:hypothetical protein